MFGQIVRHFKVTERNDRLNAVLVKRVEHVVIETQSGFIGFGFVAVGENAAPRNGRTEALEAQFAEQGDVVLIGMEKVNPLMIRVAFAGDNAVSNAAGFGDGPGGENVADGRAAPVGVPAALQLVRGDRAAP